MEVEVGGDLEEKARTVPHNKVWATQHWAGRHSGKRRANRSRGREVGAVNTLKIV